VPAGASGLLSYRDETHVELRSGTELQIDSDPARGGEKSKAFALVAGTLSAEVVAQPDEQPLVVRTPMPRRWCATTRPDHARPLVITALFGRGAIFLLD